MKKVLVPLLMAAMIGTTSLTASANPWRSENNEHEQPAIAAESLDNYDSCSKCDLTDSTWEFISTLDDIRESSIDIKTLVENIKSTSVKTDTREFEVSDVQVLQNSMPLANINGIANVDSADDTTVKVFYDDGEAWVEFSIGNPTTPDISTMSTNGNSYGFILPLDKADLLTNGLTCRFGCEANGVLCEWCRANGLGSAGRVHNGLDMSWGGIGGSNIRAVSSGTVTYRGEDPNTTGWGNYVSITHSNNSSIRTLYAHMRYAPSVSVNSYVNQGDIIGYVGETGLAYGEHLHFEVYKNGTRVDPLPYLQGAQPYGSSGSSGSTSASELYLYAPGTYKICDGPLTLRAIPNSTATSYGTLSNGTVVNISEIQKGESTLVFGKISNGANAGKWIALGKIGVELYAVNTSVTWRVFDGPLNIRQTASTSAQSYGTITNGSKFKITDVVTNGNFILAKIADSPAPTLASGSTCTVANAKGHWLALEYCEPVR